VRRKQDPLDRRSILVQRTKTGMEFLRELSQIESDRLSPKCHSTRQPTNVHNLLKLS
jgi:hypothetical protein